MARARPSSGRVRYCEASGTCPYPNAYWNGSEMRFGANYASADDVVAHELTHAVTERESNLIYWGESGAINEAFSDIFGEFVDLTNTGGADGPYLRWLMGEDLPGGAIRSMADPTLYGDPDRRYSVNWYTGAEDYRGVHLNSGVANKLAYLLTDGASFNGQTVTGQGISLVAALFYEAQVNLLVPASDYFDLYAALRQAAKNKELDRSLTGHPRSREPRRRDQSARQRRDRVLGRVRGRLPGQLAGIRPGRRGRYRAWDTVGKSTYRKASGSASAYCAAGGSSPSTGTPPVYKSYMDTWMVYGPFPLSSTTQAWAEFDLFLDVEYPFDEIFWGVSTDGVNFDGYPVSPGPDGFTVGENSYPGWSHELFNFKEISGTLGQAQVWLAFQFASDNTVEYEGAYVDNVVIQKAPSAAPFGSFDYPANGTGGLSGSVALQGWALDDYQVTKIEIHRNPVGGETPGPNGKMYVGDAVQVPGLRPDVEAVYPGYPLVYKAGWTYNLRSYFLPSGGSGTFTFFAYGYDADGLSSQLGASRTLTFANTTAGLATPTITAPLAGEVVNVTGVSFAWSAVGGADRYDLRLWRRPTAEVVYSGSVLGGSSTSTILSLPAGLYQFSVRACSGGTADAQCGPFALRSFDVSPAGPSGAPTITFPTNGASLVASTQTFQWTAVTPNPALSGMTYEVVLQNIEAGTTALQISVPAPATSTIFTMASSNHYALRVRACQASCGPWSVPVSFSVTLPAIPTGSPTITGCSVSGGNSLTCTWNAVVNADVYQVQVVQPPPAGPGGGALTVAAKQVSALTVTLPVPAGGATVFIAACNGDGCGPYGTSGIAAAGPNPSQANIGTPMAGTVVSGPSLLLTWNRVAGDNGTNTWYRLYVQDLSRQSAALDVYTQSNFYGASFKAEGARYDALVISNPGLPSQVAGPAQGFNVSGSSATAPTMVSPAHNSTVAQGNIQLGWSPVPGATLYEYFVAVQGQGTATVRGVTPGLLAQVPLTGSGGGRCTAGSCGRARRGRRASRASTQGGARGPTRREVPASPTSPSLRRQATGPGCSRTRGPSPAARRWLPRVLICPRRGTPADPNRPRCRALPARGARRPSDPAETPRARRGRARLAGDPVGPPPLAGVRAAGSSSPARASASSKATPRPWPGRDGLAPCAVFLLVLALIQPSGATLGADGGVYLEQLRGVLLGGRPLTHPGAEPGVVVLLAPFYPPRARCGRGCARPRLRRGRERRERAVPQRASASALPSMACSPPLFAQRAAARFVRPSWPRSAPRASGSPPRCITTRWPSR